MYRGIYLRNVNVPTGTHTHTHTCTHTHIHSHAHTHTHMHTHIHTCTHTHTHTHTQHTHSIKKAKRGRTLDQEQTTSTGGLFANLKQSLGASSSFGAAQPPAPNLTSSGVKLALGSTTAGAPGVGSLGGVAGSSGLKLGLGPSGAGSSGLKLGLGVTPLNGGLPFKLTMPTSSSGLEAGAAGEIHDKAFLSNTPPLPVCSKDHTP